ncbi:MAG: hypothetical protein IPL32_09110 [Chloracidobacterium sp.]|nr:hypothetical protein [Chloracidobacterium sp.]
MYKNRISRTTAKITPNIHPQFFIRRSEIEFARVAYIDSVCQVLLEGRFGPDFVYQMMDNPHDRPEFEPAVLFDLLDSEMHELVPWYAMSCLGRTRINACLRSGKFSGTHDRRAKKTQSLSSTQNELNSISTLTPNLGRGSP